MKQFKLDLKKIFDRFESTVIFHKVQLMFDCGYLMKRMMEKKSWTVDQAGSFCSEYIEELGYKSYAYQWWYAALRTTLLSEATKRILLSMGATITNVKWLVLQNEEDMKENADAILKHGEKYKFPRATPKKKQTIQDRESIEGDPDIENIVLPYPFDADDCINKLCNYFSRVAGKENGVKVLREVERKIK